MAISRIFSIFTRKAPTAIKKVADEIAPAAIKTCEKKTAPVSIPDSFTREIPQKTARDLLIEDLQQQSAIKRFIAPCVIDKNGNIIFRSNKPDAAIKIFKKLGISEYSYYSHTYTLPEKLNKDQIELINRLLNQNYGNIQHCSIDNIMDTLSLLDKQVIIEYLRRSTKLHPSLTTRYKASSYTDREIADKIIEKAIPQDLIESVYKTNKEFINSALERGLFPSAHIRNKKLYTKLAKVQLPNGEYRFCDASLKLVNSIKNKRDLQRFKTLENSVHYETDLKELLKLDDETFELAATCYKNNRHISIEEIKKQSANKTLDIYANYGIKVTHTEPEVLSRTRELLHAIKTNNPEHNFDTYRREYYEWFAKYLPEGNSIVVDYIKDLSKHNIKVNDDFMSALVHGYSHNLPKLETPAGSKFQKLADMMGSSTEHSAWSWSDSVYLSDQIENLYKLGKKFELKTEKLLQESVPDYVKDFRIAAHAHKDFLNLYCKLYGIKDNKIPKDVFDILNNNTEIRQDKIFISDVYGYTKAYLEKFPGDIDGVMKLLNRLNTNSLDTAKALLHRVPTEDYKLIQELYLSGNMPAVDVILEKINFIKKVVPISVDNVAAYEALLRLPNPAEFENLTLMELRKLTRDLERSIETLSFEVPEHLPALMEKIPTLKLVKEAGGIKEFISEQYAKLQVKSSPVAPKIAKQGEEIGSISRFFNLISSKKLNKSLLNVDFANKCFANGLPLAIPREKFILQIKEILAKVPESERRKLTKNFEFIIDDAGDIIGFPHALKKLPENASEATKELNKVIDTFLYRNKVSIPEYPELEQFANSVIDAFPEFTSIIGKRQHGTQAYTVDIHTLKVLQECIRNPKYKDLSPSDKTVLNLSVLFHDIGKKANVVDPEHYLFSADYARDIMRKLKLTNDMKFRIHNFVKNHHWLAKHETGVAEKVHALSNWGEYNIGELINNYTKAHPTETVNKTREQLIEEIAKSLNKAEIAVKFRSEQDFEMAKIFAEADLKGVSDGFYTTHKEAFTHLKELEAHIQDINGTGIRIFTPNLKGKLVPDTFTNVDGVKVLDFVRNPEQVIKNFTGVEQVDDLALLVHMTDPTSQSFNALRTLCTPGNQGILSVSRINNLYRRTYGNQAFGVIVNPPKRNILLATDHNFSSGNTRDDKSLLGYLLKGATEIIDNSSHEQRATQAKFFTEKFGLRKTKIKDMPYDNYDLSIYNYDEYGEIYEHLLKFDSIAQIKSLTLKSGRTLSAEELQTAVKEYQNSLFNHGAKGTVDCAATMHNELVTYSPEIKGLIAKVDTIEEIPGDMMHFAKENNLPILLFGRDPWLKRKDFGYYY